MKLYHATWTKTIRRIRKRGLLCMQTSNWVDATRQRQGNGWIYAFTDKRDAVRWASKMEWDHYRATGTGKTVVLTLETYGPNWEPDQADPLTRVSYAGGWLRTCHHVPAPCIVAAETVTPAMVRDLIATTFIEVQP